MARAARDDFADDVSFVSLDAVDDPALVAAAIARRGRGGDRTAFEQMVLYLQERELLLVLDGFERIVDAARRRRPRRSDSQWVGRDRA
ncbi:MAG: hypothetical protein WBF34_30300 [Streptosporangiaceae bacterium]